MIDRLLAHHRRRRALGAVLATAGLAFWPLLPLCGSTAGAAGGALLLGLAVGLLAARIGPGRDAMVRHLDRVVPEIEDSAELLGESEAGLPPLQRNQRRRVAERLQGIETPRLLSWRPVWRGLVVGLVGWGLGAALTTAGISSTPPAGDPIEPAPSNPAAPEEIDVVILHRATPPDYTGLPPQDGTGLGLEVVVGTEIEWWVQTTGPLAALRLESPAGDLFPAPTPDGGWRWTWTAEADRPFRLSAERHGEPMHLTEWELLEVVPDRPPQVRIEAPERRLELDPDEVGTLPLRVVLSDDFGLAETPTLVATLAQGSGENVSFRERRHRLPAGQGSATRRTVSTSLDLRALGLEPGSELVFHVATLDRREPQPQSGRSASRIVRVRGGSGATLGLGRGIPLLTPPEVFRSQRQILIDTEALLEAAPRLAPQELRRRAEAIGFDQRALRMRYGALLGEETVAAAPLAEEADSDTEENTQPESSHHGHDHPDPPTHDAAEGEETPLLAGVPEELAHAHDNAETATYFPDPVRRGLRGALAAMWDAERHLRAVEPAAALPFERVALEALQELKRATRVYVERIGFEAPALDASRRLGGELDEIAPRSPPPLVPADSTQQEILRRAFAELDAPLAITRAREILVEVDSVIEVAPHAPSRLRWWDLRTEVAGLADPDTPLSRELRQQLRGVLWGWLDEPTPTPARRVQIPAGPTPKPSVATGEGSR